MGYYWTLRKAGGKKYDPNQPRVPAGSTGGGRWTSGGGPSVAPLSTTFKNASVARWWLDMEAFPKKEGKSVTGLNLLSDEQVVEVAETVRDLMDKAPSPYMVDRLTVKENYGSRYDPSIREVFVDPGDTASAGLDQIRREIGSEMDLGYVGEDYRKHLLSMKASLDSGDYKDLHTRYWFEEDRDLEAIIRHEWGHAFHEVYGKSPSYGGPRGINSFGAYGSAWKSKYGLTARARDNWMECVAENFVAWSTGNADRMDPALAKAFSDLAETGR